MKESVEAKESSQKDSRNSGRDLEAEIRAVNPGKSKKIFRQIFLSIILIIGITVGLCILMNTSFLGISYQQDRIRSMISSYDTLKEASRQKILYKNSYRVTFENICSDNSLSILITEPDNSIRLSSEEERISNGMQNQLIGMLLDLSDDDNKLLRENSSYKIVRHYDSRVGGDFLVLYGSLPDGNTILIRSALESIRRSVEVSNRFLLLASMVAVLIAAIFATFLARRITKPITELSEISRKMTHLDFDARYTPRKHTNEIDELGVNINQLSNSLEKAIGELKQANADLKHDLEIRNKSEQMRKDFLSNVSHELKTPISLIQGYAEGLEEGISDSPEDRKFYCDVIVDEAKKMNRMVQQLLALNQLEYGSENVSLERFDIVPVIDALLSNLRIVIEQNGITVDFDRKACPIWADEFFVEQAVNNYLTNAIHYAKNEKIIRIWTSPAEEKPGIRLNVFNSGDPIPEESISHLWEKFYKVDKARTREYGGSGIGLSVVKAVADNLDRKCGVYNQPDGVVFWIEFDN
ncbi:MAG: HAMP domain-containing sensor histidine kinase [Lachnospiraceae bacterium]|nr:HAMP domain-containing sensor histidine kinase [Lachnospiraceae bacterium]